MFSKNVANLSNTYSIYNGFYAFAEIKDSYSVLNGVFNWRIEDAQSWTEIIEDIEQVLSTPDDENIYNSDGTLYQGKYNIEQSSDPDSYCLRVCYNTDNVISPTTIYSYKEKTCLCVSDKGLQLHIPTKQILVLIKAWRSFLMSDNEAEEGWVNIDFSETSSC